MATTSFPVVGLYVSEVEMPPEMRTPIQDHLHELGQLERGLSSGLQNISLADYILKVRRYRYLMSLAGYHGKKCSEKQWHRESSKLAKRGQPPLPYYSTQETQVMRWKFNSEWQHYMQVWRQLCETAMLNNGAHQARKLNYKGRDPVAGPAYDQQREEARIAQRRGILDRKYHPCAAAADNDYSCPADLRLFDAESTRNISQWRIQEEVALQEEVARQTEALSNKKSELRNLETTVRGSTSGSGHTSAKQVLPHRAGTAALHVSLRKVFSNPGLNASAPVLDRFPEQGEYSQRSSSQPVRPSANITAPEYHPLLHQANPVVANVHGHTRGVMGSSSGNSSLLSSPQIGPSSFRKELTFTRQGLGEVDGSSHVDPIHAAASSKPTWNPEAGRLLSRSQLDAVLNDMTFWMTPM